MHPCCILVDDDATDGEATDKDATDEDATDEDATDEDATDEDAADEDRSSSAVLPNQCNQCDFASNKLSHLKRHMKIRSGEKSHKCYQCDGAYDCGTKCWRTEWETEVRAAAGLMG